MVEMTIGIFAYSKSASDTVGGVEAQVTHTAKVLAKKGYNVVIHCLASEDAGISYDDNGFYFQKKTVQISDKIKVCYSIHGPSLDGAINENVEVSKENKENLIFCFGTRDGYVFDIAITTSKIINIPLVSFIYFSFEERWFRSHFSSRTRSIVGIASEQEKKQFYSKGEEVIDNVVRNSTIVIVPTHYIRAQVLSIAGIDKITKVKVCYHGADEEIFLRAEQDWNCSNDVLNVARLKVPYACDKGFLWALDFYSKNYNKLKTNKLVFCGAGNGQEIINDFIVKKNLCNKILVAGFLNQAQLAEKYRKASYLLVPSMMEAGCTVIIEAVMSGCLPIALDSAGLAEVMEGIGLEDFIVQGNIRKIADTVEVIVPDENKMIELFIFCENNQEYIHSKINNARAIAIEKYSLSSTTNKLLRIMNQNNLLEA